VVKHNPMTKAGTGAVKYIPMTEVGTGVVKHTPMTEVGTSTVNFTSLKTCMSTMSVRQHGVFQSLVWQ